MTVTALKANITNADTFLEPIDMPMSSLRDELGEALYFRDYYTRELREAEALLAHVTARVQKRKAKVEELEASIVEMRVKAHMAGMDRSFGKDLMDS